MDHPDGATNRLIRTDFTFDPMDIEGKSNTRIAGFVSAVWYKSSEDRIDVRSMIPQFLEYRPSSDQPKSIHPYKFLDTILRGGNIRGTDPFRNEEIFNPIIVDTLLDLQFIIQNSPISEITLRDLLRLRPDISIGTYIGIAASNGEAALMLLTVPGGIVLVGAGIAVSKSLQDGLVGRMRRLAGGAPRPKRRMTQDDRARADRIRQDAAEDRLPE